MSWTYKAACEYMYVQYIYLYGAIDATKDTSNENHEILEDREASDW